MEEEGKELIKHFSHEEHPLVLIHNLQSPVLCYGCQSQIPENEASYSCSSCEFHLHRGCAGLPLQITHPLHHHPLNLHKNPPYSCICDACGKQDWKFFSYNCSSCKFDLDVSCAVPQEGFKHKSHEHPLILQNRVSFFLCNACHTYKADYSYSCGACSFWIHRECALLRETVDYWDHRRDHPLKLSYCIPDDKDFRSFKHWCPVCHAYIHTSRWVYYCGPCRYFVHINCVLNSQQHQPPSSRNDVNDSSSNIYGALPAVKLPSSHAAKQLITQFIVKGDDHSTKDDYEEVHYAVPMSLLELEVSNEVNNFGFPPMHSHTHPKKGTEEVVELLCHGNPLILLPTSDNTIYKQNQESISKTSGGDYEEDEEKWIVCDACMDPISNSDPRYACVDNNCGFSLHVVCYNLPKLLRPEKLHWHQLQLRKRKMFAFSFRCNICQRLGNSMIYMCESCDFWICIRCASAGSATSILHNAHPLHVLSQTWVDRSLVCDACGYGFQASVLFGFGCEHCKFYLHYFCALLPPVTKRRWHDHPLPLKYPHYPDHPDEFYCCVCEHGINPNGWMYDCAECEYFLHTWCIGQFGKFGIMKFGVEFNDNDHSHPLVLVRRAKYKASCKVCGEDLEGGFAFECFTCGYHLCMGCAALFAAVVASNMLTVSCEALLRGFGGR